jgi:hypothetical protein
MAGPGLSSFWPLASAALSSSFSILFFISFFHFPCSLLQSVPEKTKDGVATQWRKNGVPGLVGTEWAVKRFVDGLAMDKAIITFPAFMYWGSLLLAHAPLPVMDFLLRVTPTRFSFMGFGATRNELVSPTPSLAKMADTALLQPPIATSPSASGRVSSASPASKSPSRKLASSISSGLTTGEVSVAPRPKLMSPTSAGGAAGSPMGNGAGSVPRSRSPSASAGGRRASSVSAGGARSRKH